MNKLIKLVLSLISTGFVYNSNALSQTEHVLREKHQEALNEVVKNVDDMWYETQTTHSQGLNYTQANGFGVNRTNHTTTVLKFNTPAAGKAFNIYKKALQPFLSKIFKRDILTSCTTGLVAGVSSTLGVKDKILFGLALLPGIEIIGTNLSEKELAYFNERSLEVHDNLYSNISWYTMERLISSYVVCVLTGAISGGISAVILKK